MLHDPVNLLIQKDHSNDLKTQSVIDSQLDYFKPQNLLDLSILTAFPLFCNANSLCLIF